MKATTTNHLPIDHIAFDRVIFRWQYQKSLHLRPQRFLFAEENRKNRLILPPIPAAGEQPALNSSIQRRLGYLSHLSSVVGVVRQSRYRTIQKFTLAF